MTLKTGILLVQLGSPKSPSVPDVKAYLRDFLSDRRLITNQGLGWKILLNAIILPTRSPKSAAAYASIHTERGFPLIFQTEDFSQAVARELPDYPVRHCFVLGQAPFIPEGVQSLLDQGCTTIRVIPQYPQYSASTTLSIHDVMYEKVIPELESQGYDMAKIEFDWIEWFHNTKAFIDSLADRTVETLKEQAVQNKAAEVLLVSFHGLPKQRIYDGDPYYYHCRETFQLLGKELKRRSESDSDFTIPEYICAFQSQFGREEWLKPSTENKTIELAQKGIKNLAVICPAFTVDNLETNEEIDIELRETFIENGGENFATIPCLNDDPRWVKRFASEIADPQVSIERHVPTEAEVFEFPPLGEKPASLTPEAKKILKVVFMILFLDLVSFSMIFPLFPSLLDYYLYSAPESTLLNYIVGHLNSLAAWAGATGDTETSARIALAVLFGGFLSFIYSGIQFIVAPIMGTLSDKIGRKPVLFVSVFGLALSYLWWGFAGTFTTLFFARLLGGLMGSNISTATAVVADITDKKSRSKGMAIVGISFGLGFIFGPVIGGLSAQINLLDYFPSWQEYGINPFSVPALISFVSSMVALHFVYHNLPETLPKSRRNLSKSLRTFNVFKLFKKEKYPGVSEVNLTNFFFLAAFSGTEFTLTFLAVERLNYTPAQNGLLFLFIGMTLAFTQGGYVRRKASIVGENKMAIQGLWILMPALIGVGFSHHTWMLYLSTFFMAIGSAQVIPCITAMVSKYSPASEQGRVLGTFRSLGALGRTIGPLVACVLYWRANATMPYIAGAAALLIPILLLRMIKKLDDLPNPD